MNFKKIATSIESFIKEKTKKLNGVVIGLSGGLDSTVVAYLAVKALGKDKVYGLIMPYIKNQNTEDGIEIAKTLGIKYEIIEIKQIVEIFEKKKHFSGKLPKGNLMARIRMCLLYGVANEKNMLVLGTSNKSELEIGYFTKYGDGGVDIEPIGDLYKTEVFELAIYLKVLKKIIEKTPSADLWVGQTDETEIGIKYQMLDKILKGEIKGMDKKIIEKVKDMNKKTQHKREMLPYPKLRIFIEK